MEEYVWGREGDGHVGACAFSLIPTLKSTRPAPMNTGASLAARWETPVSVWATPWGLPPFLSPLHYKLSACRSMSDKSLSRAIIYCAFSKDLLNKCVNKQTKKIVFVHWDIKCSFMVLHDEACKHMVAAKLACR